jgi:hypothetical protein
MTRNRIARNGVTVAEYDKRLAVSRAADRQAREVRETAETLVEDRGRANALAWAEHCAVSDSSVGGFWRAVADAIRELAP